VVDSDLFYAGVMRLERETDYPLLLVQRLAMRGHLIYFLHYTHGGILIGTDKFTPRWVVAVFVVWGLRGRMIPRVMLAVACYW
jgi:hypothetical protein